MQVVAQLHQGMKGKRNGTIESIAAGLEFLAQTVISPFQLTAFVVAFASLYRNTTLLVP